MKLELIATATFGLEAVVRREIEALGYEIIKTEEPKLSEAEVEEPDDATPDLDFDNLTEEQKKELLESAIEETDKPDVPDLSELTATAPETATVFDSSTQ